MQSADASYYVVRAIRAIDRDTGDTDIDDEADRLEGILARAGARQVSWLRELLFRYRGIQISNDEDAAFGAVVERSGSVLTPAAVRAVQKLAVDRRGRR